MVFVSVEMLLSSHCCNLLATVPSHVKPMIVYARKQAAEQDLTILQLHQLFMIATAATAEIIQATDAGMVTV